MRSRHGWGAGSSAPPWWPDGERWPPAHGFGSAPWGEFGRRFVRGAIFFMVAAAVVPLAIGVAIAVAVGGWEAVGIALVVALALALLLALGARAIGRGVAPIRDLVAATGRLAEGDTTARMTATSRSMSPVVTSFNQMAERLENAEEQRRRLMADLSHELRTPLTVIRGELEAFADGVHEPNDARIGELLEDVEVMERLLGDLQTLSTSEAGMLTLHREPIDLVDLAASVVHNFGDSAELRSVGRAVDIDADPIRIREVLTNLVANAVRASPNQAAVTVDVGVDEAGNARIRVIDAGAGIEPGELDHIFDRFHKGPNSAGSGLGLTISRHLVEAHEGSIVVESTLGLGTTVTVTLPRAPPSA